MTRILIADDHAIVRQGLKQVLGEELAGTDFGEAATSAEALDRVRAEAWDAVILDISLPGRSGLEVLKEMKQARRDMPVLILSMHSEEQFAVRALRAGASGYLTKQTAPEELVSALRKLLGGGRYVSLALAEKLAGELAGTEKAPHETLSDREFQVLRMLASGKTVTEISDELALSVQTISTYRTRILTKMGMATNADLTQYALHHSLI